jgi:serine protease
MNKIQCSFTAAIIIACTSSHASVANSIQDEAGNGVRPTIEVPQAVVVAQSVKAAQRTNEQIDIVSKRGIESDTTEIYVPGASFIKLHFSKFKLPTGITVEVSNLDGSEVYRYSKAQRGKMTFDPVQGDDGKYSFSAMSITGDTALVTLKGKRGLVNGMKHRLQIDYYMEGFPEESLESDSSAVESIQYTGKSSASKGGSRIMTTCGSSERFGAVCYAGSHPEEFDRSRPVVKILVGGSRACTAWRVGPDNRIFTNNHCISSQEDASSTEVWFNYQAVECGGFETEVISKVPADQLLVAHQILDFALLTVKNFNEIAGFGYLGLEVREGVLGESIYIPQHGSGRPKQLAIESDMNSDGLCHVDELDHDAYAADTDLGYYCDSAGGSSGSPVLSGSSHRAIALHHFGGCVNSGVKMSLIWPEVAAHFNGVVPAGDDELLNENLPPQAVFESSCDGLNCSFDADGSLDPDGSIVDYSWGLSDGASASGASIVHEFSANGSYEVTLTVTDNENLTGSVTGTVSVNSNNSNPVAAFSYSCANTNCSFDAAASSDSDGSIVAYNWSFGDGDSASLNTATVSHVYSAGGDYNISLVVEDELGATASASTTITVSSPPGSNTPPIADFTFSCDGLSCQFDASSSEDPDGLITDYSWSFGDGRNGSGKITNHTFADGGVYDITLSVADNSEASSTKTREVQVAVVFVPPIDLSGLAGKYRGGKYVDISWSGASTNRVDLYRDGSFLFTTFNDCI